MKLISSFFGNSQARALLVGSGMLPVGWVLLEVLGVRSSRQEHRNDEHPYTLLPLVGLLILTIGLVCILVRICTWPKQAIQTC